MSGLDGYRGVRPPALRQAITEASRGDEHPLEAKYQRLLLGVAAEKVQAGLASRVEEDNVLAAVVMAAERDAMDAMRELLAIPNPASESAHEAHYTARVAAGVLMYINNLIRDGISAGREIDEHQEDDA